MRWVIAACGLLAGCDLFFPLADPPAPATPTVTGKAIIRSVETDADRQPQPNDQPADNTLLKVHFEDGTELNVAIQPDGSFEFARSTDAYRLEILRGTDVLELFDNAPSLALMFGFVGRDDARPFTTASPPTTIRFPAGITPNPVIATTGQWTVTVLGGVSVLDWKQVASNGRREVGLLDATDTVFFLEYVDDIFAPGQRAIAQHGSAAFDMVENTEEDLSISMTPVLATANACVQIDLHLQAAVTRISELLSTPGYGPVAFSWNIASTPALETGILGALNLVGATPPMLDIEPPFDVPLFDPFPGQKLLAGTGAVATRRISHPNALLDTTLSAGISHIVEVSHSVSCAENPADLRPTVAIVDSIAIDGRILDVEGKLVTVSNTGSAVVTWAADTGVVDYYDVVLTEVALNDSGNTELRSIRRFRTRDQRVPIAEEFLQSGHLYVVTVNAVLGLGKVSEGDYQTATYPAGNTVIHTPVFQVE